MWQKYIDGQYRKPSGIVGRWIGRRMAQQHQPENLWTVNLLNVQPTDHILEIGFGPGFAVEQAVRRASRVCGVDFSPTMVAAANERNADAIRAGKVDLRQGDAAQIPFGDALFDKAYSIHSIYFWPDPLAALREIHRVLKPGGLLILTVLPKEKWNPENPELAGTPECKPYSGDDLQRMMSSVGFTDINIAADTNPAHDSNYSVMGRKSGA